MIFNSIFWKKSFAHQYCQINFKLKCKILVFFFWFPGKQTGDEQSFFLLKLY